ncbi:MAG: hypothetical protein O7G88_13590, partial [bacterium]|nr:hypothetical protein [bacterium]
MPGPRGREKYSPLATGMYTELGGLNKWCHNLALRELRGTRPHQRRDSPGRCVAASEFLTAVHGQARDQDADTCLLLAHALRVKE